jgi:hypothetical protein
LFASNELTHVKKDKEGGSFETNVQMSVGIALLRLSLFIEANYGKQSL